MVSDRPCDLTQAVAAVEAGAAGGLPEGGGANTSTASVVFDEDGGKIALLHFLERERKRDRESGHGQWIAGG